MEQENSQDFQRSGFGRHVTKKRIVILLLVVMGLSVIGLVLGFSSPAHNNKTIQHPVSSMTGGEQLTDGSAGNQTDHSGSSVDDGHTAQAVEEKSYAPFAEGQQETGVAFVTATIAPLDYELNKRFWGWRPNDIINVTDNINNFQLGVLEATRRTVERLVENISRTGSTAAFDKNLENARSTCFMVEAERYWFPSPENKYNDGLDELKRYAKKLKRREAVFYTRADSLIPLLLEFEHLLGSCDDNLVKMHEKDGSKVSFFSADDYFFYAKGVASAMATILTAVEKDFHLTLDRRNSLPDLHHAIESCRHAAHIEPLIIMESDLDSVFANHRSNIAAHISHARFYLGVVIKSLST